MPELPEVETIVRGLRPRLEGRPIRAVWSSGLPLRLARPLALRRLRALCVGERFASVGRRGKYILLATGPEAGVSVHLGMSGRLRLQPASEPRPDHTHVVFTLDRGDELRFIDPAPLRIGHARGAPGRPARARAARAGSPRRARRRRARAASRGCARAHQGVPARPEAHRRPGQHLRLRGAAPRGDPPGRARRPGARPRRRPPRRDPRRARERHREPRHDSARLRRRRRQRRATT